MTLFFFIRKATPFDSCLATARERATTLSASKRMSFAENPNSIEMVQQMIDLRAAQQRLGRNAAPIEADAAELIALDDRGLHAELRRPDRRDIAARPAAETIRSNEFSATRPSPSRSSWFRCFPLPAREIPLPLEKIPCSVISPN